MVLDVGEFEGFDLLLNLCFGFLIFKNGKVEWCDINSEERVFLRFEFLLVGMVIFMKYGGGIIRDIVENDINILN